MPDAIVEVAYHDLLDIRREDHSRLYYNPYENHYQLYMNDGQILLVCNVAKGSPEAADFEANRQALCNKRVKVNEWDPITHDFTDSNTWLCGTTNSLFMLAPLPKKVLTPKFFLAHIDKDSTIGAGQDFVARFWQTEDGTSPCPGRGAIASAASTSEFTLEAAKGEDFQANDWIRVDLASGHQFHQVQSVTGDTLTLASPLPAAPDPGNLVYLMTPRAISQTFNPAGGQFTGWHRAFPDPSAPDEFVVWVYLVNGHPIYKVTEFVYHDIASIKHKADESDEEGTDLYLKFLYRQIGTHVTFTYTLNEHITFHIANHTPYAKPNGIRAVCTTKFDSEAEF